MNELFTKNGEKWKKRNFKSIKDYKQARAKEVKERGLGDSDAGVNVSKLKNKVQGLVDNFLLPVPKIPATSKVKKQNPFHGVTRAPKGGTYMTQVYKSRKKCFAGTYDLETDAAFVYDLVVNELFTKNGEKWEKRNFKSVKDYKQARAKEVKERGLNESDTGVDVSLLKSKVQCLVDNFLLQVPNIPKTSTFRGTSKPSMDTKYRAQISCNKTAYDLGKRVHAYD